MTPAERIARAFHETYERLAPVHGWETQERSRTAWEDVPEENRALMIHTVEHLMDQGMIRRGLRVTGTMTLTTGDGAS